MLGAGTLRRLWLILFASLVLAACGASGPSFDASDVTGSSFGHDFALKDAKGNTRTLADFRGKAVVVFFGYTQCPDVCPATLATLAQAMKELGSDADRVQVLFITVDPERDTVAEMKSYAANFTPRLLALTGSAEQVAAAAKAYKVFYR